MFDSSSAILVQSKCGGQCHHCRLTETKIGLVAARVCWTKGRCPAIRSGAKYKWQRASWTAFKRWQYSEKPYNRQQFCFFCFSTCKWSPALTDLQRAPWNESNRKEERLTLQHQTYCATKNKEFSGIALFVSNTAMRWRLSTNQMKSFR